jgi:hypothetical protein
MSNGGEPRTAATVKKSNGTIFRRNIGGIDRVVRLIMGTVLLSLGLLQLGTGNGHGWQFTIFGIVGLATGLSRYCPLYIPFGISTARTKSREIGTSAPARESQLPRESAGGTGR